MLQVCTVKRTRGKLRKMPSFLDPLRIFLVFTIIIVIYKIPKKEKFLKFLILDKKQKRKKEAIMHPSISTPLIMVIELIGEQMEMESKWTTESKSDCKDHQWFLHGCYKNIIYCTC